MGGEKRREEERRRQEERRRGREKERRGEEERRTESKNLNLFDEWMSARPSLGTLKRLWKLIFGFDYMHLKQIKQIMQCWGSYFASVTCKTTCS